jgi:hypothetical protein
MSVSSIKPLSSQGGHSSRVNMRLLFNGYSLPVAQIGPDFILVDEPVNHPPTAASVIFQVDETERHWKVQLPFGISCDLKKVAIIPAV